jgi:hypothetical protein
VKACRFINLAILTISLWLTIGGILLKNQASNSPLVLLRNIKSLDLFWERALAAEKERGVSAYGVRRTKLDFVQ